MNVFLLYIVAVLIAVAKQVSLQSSGTFAWTEQSSQTGRVENPNMNIVLSYYPQNGANITSSMTVYNNGSLTPMFEIPGWTMSCANYHVFTLNQSATQFQDNTQYFLTLSHISIPIQIQITTYFQIPVPTLSQSICYPPNCTIILQNNCNQSTLQYYNSVFVNVSSIGHNNNTQITQFQYNFICNYTYYYTHLPIQWGILAIVIFSIFMIFITSKFQQAKSYSNLSIYVNYPIIIAYCIISITKFLLVYFNVPYIIQVIYYICITGSVFAGTLSIMLCFSQIVYRTKLHCFRFGYFKGRFRIRVMDVIGFLIGFGAMCGWYLSQSNWIVSDVIFIFIYIAVIKIAKFGSLKIALVNFICTLVIDLIFITIVEIVNKQYVFSNINIFSNPLFLVAPLIAYISNYKCAWYFILSMAYPGMFLAYLERFDKNRSSTLYAPIFIICYALCSIAWFIVSILVPFGLPYDLFTVPISMGLLLLFANRRGQLEDLWNGRFFDQQKTYYENQKQLIQNLKRQKSPSTITYQKQMFSSLKYDGLSRYSRNSSDTSNFSQIVAAVNKQLQLKPVYSGRQKQQKRKNDPQLNRDMHQSNQTQLVSQIQPNSNSQMIRDSLFNKS